jgi:RNA polymerase sigma-70 factor (ECF subfamily)
MSSDPLVRYLESPSASHFASLVTETMHRIFGAAYRVLGDRSLAEDVTQDVYVKVLTGGIRPKDAAFGAVSLLVRARVTAGTMRKSDRRRLARERMAHGGRIADESASLSREDVWDVRDAVGELPADVRAAVELRYFSGLQVSEVARVLGAGERTVYKLLGKGRAMLQARLTASAAALILPALKGTGEAALPGIAVSEEFAARLRNLPSTTFGGKVSSRRIPSRLVRSGIAAAAVAAVALSLLGVAGLARLDGGRGKGKDRGPVARAGLDIQLGPDRVVGARAGGQLAAAPGVPGPAGEGEAGGEAKAPGAGGRGRAAGGAGDAQPHEKEATSVVLRVIDENGDLLDDGNLDLKLSERKPSRRSSSDKGMDPEIEEELIRAFYLEPRLLSRENPVILENLPKGVLGREFQATMSWGPLDLPPERSVVFEAERGKTVTVDLVVPVRPRREIVVVDASTREPIAGAFAWPTDRASLGGGGGFFTDEQGAIDPMVSTQPLKTDALGRCTVLGAPGRELEFKVWADGYVNAVIREEALGADGVVRLEPRGGELSGSLAVRLVAPSRWRSPWFELIGRNLRLFKDTDGVGRLVFEKLEPGTYVLKLANFSESARFEGPVVIHSSGATRVEYRPVAVDKDEECAFTTTVQVRAGGETEVTIGGERPRSSVTVNVADELGRPREG